MKVSKKQKRLFVRTMICTVSLVTACFFCSSLEAAAAPRAQETGERVTIVIDPGHGGENEGTLEGIVQEKKMTMVFYSVFITMHPWIMTCSVPKYGSLPYSHTMPTAINSAGNRCNR